MPIVSKVHTHPDLFWRALYENLHHWCWKIHARRISDEHIYDPHPRIPTTSTYIRPSLSHISAAFTFEYRVSSVRWKKKEKKTGRPMQFVFGVRSERTALCMYVSLRASSQVPILKFWKRGGKDCLHSSGLLSFLT